jgi:hypothetical protein
MPPPSASTTRASGPNGTARGPRIAWRECTSGQRTLRAAAAAAAEQARVADVLVEGDQLDDG